MGRAINSPADLANENKQFLQDDRSVLDAYNKDEQFRIFCPVKYIKKRILRFFLLFFILSVFFYKLFAVVLIPCYVLAFYKYRIFVGHIKTLNISGKKMWVILCIWIIMTIVCGILIRKAFFTV